MSLSYEFLIIESIHKILSKCDSSDKAVDDVLMIINKLLEGQDVPKLLHGKIDIQRDEEEVCTESSIFLSLMLTMNKRLMDYVWKLNSTANLDAFFDFI